MSNFFSSFTWQSLAARLIVLLIALPVHECAHGLVSSWLGDPTAKNRGRISLNPVRHLDLVGSLCILLMGFGWAKPVPIDPRYYKNPKVGMALSAAAGPVSNLLMALLAMIWFKLLGRFGLLSPSVAAALVMMVFYMISINITLAVFNLLPMPPLDGSRIFLVFLPQRLYFNIMKYERYLLLGLYFLIFTGLLNRPLSYLTSGVMRGLDFVTGFLGRIF